MVFPLLPSLKNNSQIGFSKSGVWATGAQNTLPGLVDSLKVAANKHSDISSIPDVWARPRLMEAVLKDKGHPQHQKYVNEWRGILGILSMRKLRGLNKVGRQKIEIPDFDKLPENAPAFLQVVARSLPDDYKKEQNDDTLVDGIQAKIQILTYDDKPLAILWPSILVCPAVEVKINPAEVSWSGIDGLHDPIISLSDDEKLALINWLQSIIDITDAKNNTLMELLTSFQRDIKKALGNKYTSTESSSQLQNSDTLGITGFGKCLNQTIVGVLDKNFLKNSQVRLVKQRDKDIPEILVMAPDLDTQWGKKPSDIHVAGFITASTCMHKADGVFLPDEHTQLGDIDLSDYNAEIRMADEFFTDKIAIFHVDYNAFPFVLNNKLYQYGDQEKVNIILPIKKRLLDYLEPTVIAQSVDISIENNKDIKVKLTLPVVGPKNEIRKISATKTYKAAQDNSMDALNYDSDIEEYDTIPLIQIWPNIRLQGNNDWKAYYTYFDESYMESNFYAYPYYNNDNSDNDEEQTQKIPNVEAFLTKGDSFPEALVCENISRDSFSLQKETTPIGLLLLDLDEVQTINPQGLKCKIGIDFGTTNTTAYMQLGGQKPELIHFENRKFDVTRTENEKSISGHDKASVRRNFISEQKQPDNKQSSIKTMYHVNSDKAMMGPFFAGNIYYIDHARDIWNDDEIMTDIKSSDMKWDQVKGPIYRRGFLMQLCLQCLLEAVCKGASHIDWIYSYPKSFTKGNLNKYQQLWTNQGIFKDIKNSCSIASEIKVMSLSESESVAVYFKSVKDAPTRRGIMCLDIGGGSTDIAVWQDQDDSQNNGLLEQTSLKFAGRDILNDHIWERKQNGHDVLIYLKKNDSDFDDLLDKLHEEKDRHKFDLKLEALLRDYEENLFSALLLQQNNPEVTLLIRDISFALSGIFFYCGMLIGYLRKEGKYDTTQYLPYCYVGGNASKLLHWAAGGEFSNDLMISDVFKDCFFEGLNITNPNAEEVDDFEIEMTEHPKQEVAYGLVADDNLQQRGKNRRNNEDIDNSTLAGEFFSVGERKNEIGLITADDFLQNIRIDNRKPEIFQKFMARFNQSMRPLDFKDIKFSEHNFIEICDKVNQNLGEIKKQANGQTQNITVEPIFILVLKEAYAYLAKHTDL